MLRFARWSLVATLLALLGHGCHAKREFAEGPPVSRFQNPGVDPLAVRRVVMLPLVSQHHDDATGQFGALLAAELRTKGAFELITPPPEEAVAAGLGLTIDSLYDNRLLAYLGRRYRADAVMVGRINHYHAYWPPSISLTLHCVDARSGEVLASVDGNWDSRNKFVAQQAQHFYMHLEPHHRLHDDQLVLNAPSYFLKFVAREVAESFYNQPPWRSFNAEPAGDGL